MVSAAYYGHIMPAEDFRFNLECAGPHPGAGQPYNRLRFSASMNNEVIIYLTDDQLAQVISRANDELAARLAAKGVQYLKDTQEPPLLKETAEMLQERLK